MIARFKITFLIYYINFANLLKEKKKIMPGREEMCQFA